MVKFSCALVDFAVLGHVVDDLLVEDVHLSHSLVDQWKELDVLGSILNHGMAQWPCFPELFVVLHGRVDLVLFLVSFVQVVFEEVVEANVDVSIVILLEEIRDKPVSYLCIKYKVANDVELTN